MRDLLDRYGEELKTALTIRLTEQRLLRLFSEGKLFGTVHTSIGQEFVGISVARCLTDADTIFSNHRGHGHFLAYRPDLLGLIGEVMGRSVGVCGGRGGSQHLQWDSFYSNGIQGGIAPVTVGMAFAHTLKETGGIAIGYIGDGTLGEGIVYESMNIASKWDLPVLFVCENNLYAQSTCQTQTLAGDICARAAAFGIDTFHSNTWEWPQLFEAMQRSVDSVRLRSRPVFHRVDTYRLAAHSKGDDNRPEAEVQAHWKRDPINVLMEQYGQDPLWQRMLREVSEEIERAVAEAEATPCGEVDPVIAETSTRPRAYHWRPRTFETERCVAAVRTALQEALATYDTVVLIGEDIESPYGGAFKCTMGLSTKCPERVRNTPLSEATIVGIGNGLALRGMIPVVEIMFGDFLPLAADQWINHAAKFRFMYNGKVRVPLIVRTPMGGKRGYGATHSQSIEKHFVGLPDTQVLCLHHRYSPVLLYRDLFDTIDRPTLVIENKLLYAQNVSAEPLPGYRLLYTDETFPTARLKPDFDAGGVKADLTVVSIGGMSLEVEEAARRLFEDEEIVCDMFFPSRLYPFDAGVLKESLYESRRLLVVEEGQGFGSISSEVIAQIAERFGQLGVTCGRVTAMPSAIPAAKPLEQRCLPGTEHVIAKALEIVGEFVH